MSEHTAQSAGADAAAVEHPGCSLSVHALTDKGNVREHNEDAFTVLPGRGLLIVSDGMGGHNAGAIASQLIVELLPDMVDHAVSSLDSPDTNAVMDAIRETLTGLSREIRQRSKGLPGLSGMGATVVLALLRENEAIIGHMGDSRAYLFRDGDLRLLTDDHSVVGLLLREGEIAPQDARNHPARGMLSRYMGMEDEVYPDVQAVSLVCGDRILLCTDGLTNELTEQVIAYILYRHPDPEEACTALINAAKEAEARDNITAVLAEWSQDGLDEMELVPAEESPTAVGSD